VKWLWSDCGVDVESAWSEQLWKKHVTYEPYLCALCSGSCRPFRRPARKLYEYKRIAFGDLHVGQYKFDDAR